MLETFHIGNLVVNGLPLAAGVNETGALEQVEVLGDILQRTPCTNRNLVNWQFVTGKNPKNEQAAGIGKDPALGSLFFSEIQHGIIHLCLVKIPEVT